MILDCAIIGGGPAGMSAALMLGRAKRNIVLFDENRPRNAVTQHSHGFLTRDGIRPADFRAQGREDISRYPSVVINDQRVVAINKGETTFELKTSSGETFEAQKVLLATGITETLPEVKGIHDFYGKSLFNCPFCDGWEMRDQPIVILTEQEGSFHTVKVVYNWSQDIYICTNGKQLFDEEQKKFLEKYNIGLVEDKITVLTGHAGQLEYVEFEHHPALARTGGLVGIQWKLATTLGQDLGCQINNFGGITIDDFGRTTVEGVYAAGDTVTTLMSAQVLFAAAAGSKAAVGVIMDLTNSFFEEEH